MKIKTRWWLKKYIQYINQQKSVLISERKWTWEVLVYSMHTGTVKFNIHFQRTSKFQLNVYSNGKIFELRREKENSNIHMPLEK